MLSSQQAQSLKVISAENAEPSGLPIGSAPLPMTKSARSQGTEPSLTENTGETMEMSELTKKLMSSLVTKDIAAALAAYLTKSRFSTM